MKIILFAVFVLSNIFLGCGEIFDPEQQKELERVISKYDLNDFTSAVMVMPIPGDIDKIDEKQNALLEDIKKIYSKNIEDKVLRAYKSSQGVLQLKYLSMFLIMNKMFSSQQNSARLHGILVEALEKKDTEVLDLVNDSYIGIHLYKRKVDPIALENLALLCDGRNKNSFSYIPLIFYRYDINKFELIIMNLSSSPADTNSSLECVDRLLDIYSRKNDVEAVKYYEKLRKILNDKKLLFTNSEK